jgi:hypothetical protein
MSIKLGVIKLGARISFDNQGTSGGTGETISLIKMMINGGAQVIALSKRIKNEPEKPIENVLIVDTLEFKDKINNLSLDALCILNGNVNFFGGTEDEYQIANYHIINNFKGPIFYILCDPELTLKQIWHSVEKKEWGKKYNKKDIEITRDDIFYICQPFNTEKVKNSFGKYEVSNIRGIKHYPFELFPFLNTPKPFNEAPTVHLSYGGTMRGGKRIKKMIKYYFGWPEDIIVEMFGKIELKDFNPNLISNLRTPNFTGVVKYDKMLEKMNSAMSHIVIGDPWYEEISDMAQRASESVVAQCITFIDSDLDKEKRFYKNDKDLIDFLYVSSREDAENKLRLLINDNSARKDIIDAQFKAINFDAKKYCTDFINLLIKNI